MPSLQAYVLVDSETREVDVFTRAHAGTWLLTDQTATGALTLSSIDLVLGLDLVFKGIASPGTTAPSTA